jgi:N-acyl-D-amino-acid deacylase
MATEYIIQGGEIIDGSGRARHNATLILKDSKILYVGHEVPAAVLEQLSPNHQIIDATGLVVAPGFIDIKTHSDFVLPINPTADSKLHQGVTTEIIGHCGFSVAPILPGKTQLLQDYLSPSAPWLSFREVGFPDYIKTYPKTSVNVGMLVGHNTLRLMVMGMDNREPTHQEMDQMCGLLDDALNGGALGLSTGLFTSPGSYSKPPEIWRLCQVLEKHHAAYFTHLRDESDQVIEALQEAIDVAEHFKIHVEVVHFKCSGMDNWGKAGQALEMIKQSQSKGTSINCDVYPYTAGSNPLKNLMPQWVQDGGVGDMLSRLSQPEVRARIKTEIDRDGLNNWGRIPSWKSIQISISPNLPEYAGTDIEEIASAWSIEPVDAICEYLVRDKGATRVFVHAISETDIDEIIKSSTSLIGSDGNCVCKTGITGQGVPHPRFYGTFPRILSRYVREKKLLDLEEAIHKMTGATAAALKLNQRGLLKAEYFADVVIFDPNDFDDLSTYKDPHQYPSGSRTMVFVNGVCVINQSTHNKALPGKVLIRDISGLVS